MPVEHLSCSRCRVRLLANDRAIELLDACCPICEDVLIEAPAASAVLGFRLFDLDAFAESEPRQPGEPSAMPTDLPAWRAAAAPQRELPARRST